MASAAVECATILNTTESNLEILVSFQNPNSQATCSRVMTVLGPGKSHLFSPSGKHMEIPQMKKLYVGTFGSSKPATSFDISKKNESDITIFSICDSQGKFEINENANNEEIKVNPSVLGASLSSLSVKSNIASNVSIELSSGHTTTVNQSSEVKIKVDNGLLNSILVKPFSNAPPLVYVVMEDDVIEGIPPKFDIVAWPGVGLSLRPPPRSEDSPSSTSSSKPTTNSSRAPLGGEAAKAGASKAKSSGKKKGKKGEDQRKLESTSDMDAFLPTKAAEPEPVIVSEPEPEPEPEVVVPEIPDSWDDDGDALVVPSVVSSSPIVIDVVPPVVVPDVPAPQTTTPVVLPSTDSKPSGSLRPGGRKVLRPGGSKSGGGAGATYKSGAGSSTDFSSSGGGAPTMTIKHRYQKDELISLKPPASAVFPTSLRLLPSYDVRTPGGGSGGSEGGKGGGGRGNEAQWGRNRTYSGGKGGGGGGGGGGQWERGRGAHHQPQLTKSKNPFLIGAMKEAKDASAEFESKIISILNKLTPQTYDKLLQQILELPIDRASLLITLIHKIFDKVVSEAAFSEIYARLCYDLDKNANHIWKYVKVVEDPNKKEYYYVADVPNHEKELMGPCSTVNLCIEFAHGIAKGDKEVKMTIAPCDSQLICLQKRGDNIVKIYQSEKGYFFSFEPFDNLKPLAEEDLAGGPFVDNPKKQTTGFEEALKKGTKVTAFKKLLLNKCQQAFETKDIYEEIERKFNEGDPTKMTAVERAERIELRELSTLKAKKQMLGNIKFVGELFKLKNIFKTDKVMFLCIEHLLSVTNSNEDETLIMTKDGIPALKEIRKLTSLDEDNIEALTNLLSTIGLKLESEMDAPYKKLLMNLYLEKLKSISLDKTFPSRVRFMVVDFFELRENNYIPRRRVDKQMTQDQIRRIASQDINNQQQMQQQQYGKGGKGGGHHHQQQQQAYQQGHQQGYQQGYQGHRGGDVRNQQGGNPQGYGGKGTGKGMHRPQQQHQYQQQHYQQQQQHQAQGLSIQAPSSNKVSQAKTTQVSGVVIDEDKVKSKLTMLVSDWISAPMEDELIIAWKELIFSMTKTKAPSEIESIRNQMAILLVSMILNRACESKKFERVAMLEFMLTLFRNDNQLKEQDFDLPLDEFLEFYEDLLTDIPTLQTNMAELLWSLVTKKLVSLRKLENIFNKYEKNGDPPMSRKTIHNFFKALGNQLNAMESQPYANEAMKLENKYA